MSKIANDYCGVVRTYHDFAKTKLKEEYFINAGKKEGIYKSYYYDGQIEIEVNHIDDKRNGIYKSYWEDGQLWEEVNFIDGLKNGIEKSYHYNGQLWKEINYIGKKV